MFMAQNVKDWLDIIEKNPKSHQANRIKRKYKKHQASLFSFSGSTWSTEGAGERGGLYILQMRI